MSNFFNKFVSAILLLSPLLVSPLNAETDAYADEDQEKVIVYNWSDYIPQQVLDSFTKETGIKVEYSTYDNNETMYMRLKLLRGRGYDVIVPSTNLVQRMARDGLLQQLDFELLDNFKNLDKNLLNKSYDPDNKFSIPYLWGTTGIAANTEVIDTEQIAGWSDLWHKRWANKLILLDDKRDVFHIALKAEGYSTNTSDADEIRLAYEKLSRLLPNIKKFSAAPLEDLAKDSAGIGMSWNGDVFAAREDIPKLKYIYPKEGVGLWVDSFVIPNRAINVDNAHAFINYMMRPEIAALCTEEMGYATPNLQGLMLLDESVRNDPVIYPSPELLKNTEFQQDVSDQALRLYEYYWDKIKAGE
ncbi:MAG: ABC transporter, periplasmic spermidine putrescine-binding protein PotD (TC 3.A.1.11.1) [uncultured Thiotrichaceae bacterium]|uniref:Putrescine-binding periplasmic protein n=1 Tax=uncultured Thiotrichaceae bacterium TaxID=298394 RepID=A0A6S6SIW8_9GAMM|nr:MAG: ABC transporter, periplasmic spermidine putrescine-binding protein PotD (TC 3.A.1.11.1) [uncultured Thiotrichaceae bacterium]